MPSSSSRIAACSSAVVRKYTYSEAGPVSRSWAKAADGDLGQALGRHDLDGGGHGYRPGSTRA